MFDNNAKKAIKEIQGILAKYGFEKKTKPKLTDEELAYKKTKRLFGILKNFKYTSINYDLYIAPLARGTH